MAMLCSEEREFAIVKIISIRGEKEVGDNPLRLRVLPHLNNHATNLRDMIKWEGATEPAITCKLTNTELQAFKEKLMRVQP